MAGTVGGMYIAKYDFNGVKQWIDYGTDPYYTFPQWRDNITAVTVDEKENIYICGKFSPKERFYYNNGANSVRLSLTDTNAVGSPEHFIAKLDKNGKYLWHNMLTTEPWHLEYNHHGRMIMTSFAPNNFHYYITPSDSIKTTNYSGPDLQLVYWIDTTGRLLKWTHISGVDLRQICTDDSGNLLITGRHGGTIFRNADGKDSLIIKGVNNIGSSNHFFLVKYDTAGRVKWHVSESYLLHLNDGGIPCDLDAGPDGTIYVSVNGDDTSFAKKFFINKDSSITQVARKAHCLYAIKDGYLKWHTYGGLSNATGLHYRNNKITSVGYNRLSSFYPDYPHKIPESDIFYSVDISKNINLPHDAPNIVIIQYDTSGNVIYAQREGYDINDKIQNKIGEPMIDIVGAENDSAFILFGECGVDSVIYLGDTVTTNGIDGIVMKVTLNLCDTTQPPIPPRVYIKAPFPDSVLCYGDTLVVYDTTLKNFNPSNKFYLDFYSPALGMYTQDSLAGISIDSFRISTFPIYSGYYDLRIRASDPYYTSPRMKVMVTNKIIPIAWVTATADSIPTSDSFVTFHVDPYYGGSNPQFQWQINGVDIPQANDTVFTTNGLQYGDKVTVKMTSSYSCATKPVISNSTKIIVTDIKDIQHLTTRLNIYPNPTAGKFFLTGSTMNKTFDIKIHNNIGQIIYLQTIVPLSNGIIYQPINLESLPTGLYLLSTNQSKPVKLLIRK